MEIRFENEVYDLTSSFSRKLLHDHIDDYFDKNIKYLVDENEEIYEELETVHELISSQNIKALLDGAFCNFEIVFLKVEQDDLLETALVEAGYQVEKSNVSRSLYVINDNGIEVRISDHKRPPIVEGNVAIHEHEYESELIIKGNVVYKNQLHEVGFTKLNKSEYLLGYGG